MDYYWKLSARVLIYGCPSWNKKCNILPFKSPRRIVHTRMNKFMMREWPHGIENSFMASSARSFTVWQVLIVWRIYSIIPNGAPNFLPLNGTSMYRSISQMRDAEKKQSFQIWNLTFRYFTEDHVLHPRMSLRKTRTCVWLSSDHCMT